MKRDADDSAIEKKEKYIGVAIIIFKNMRGHTVFVCREHERKDRNLIYCQSFI